METTPKYSPKAIRTLARMQPKIADNIRSRLRAIAIDPKAQHANVKRLKGSDGYRLRVGDWRAIYFIENGQMYVSTIGPRGSVYGDD